ncbi:MAG: chromate transporter [Oscillospiraceae bacterium]|jgi:chromate transporter|nr:chromate transporter [Oscillospiraceae bacterium]
MLLLKLAELFLIFAKIGLFTIGGGLAMLPLIRQELVERGYMTLKDTLDMVAISQMTPGPFAVNAATFAGMRMYGVAGAAAATLGAVLPSFVVCLAVAKRFFRLLDSSPTRSIMRGIRPVVYALIFSGMISISGGAIFATDGVDWAVLSIALVTTLLLWKTKISPILLILACAAVGALFLRGTV